MPLTCGFAPLAGLEPATYGLEVRHDPSAQCCPGPSPQVTLGPPSTWLHRDRHRSNDRIATGIASTVAASLGQRRGGSREPERPTALGILDRGEEAEPARVLGDQYRRHQKATRRLVPGLW